MTHYKESEKYASRKTAKECLYIATSSLHRARQHIDSEKYEEECRELKREVEDLRSKIESMEDQVKSSILKEDFEEDSSTTSDRGVGSE